jgi:glycosyltransferase involved in cell wall biosynthesis
MPYISVIIPSYNSSVFIEETLRSLADQTNQHFEVVIIDDGSEDNTIDIAGKCIDQYNLDGIVLRRPDNIPKGVSSCRNYGVESAKGDWISFLDSDDLFLPDKMAKVYQKINLYGHGCMIFENASLFFEDETHKLLPAAPKPGYSEPRYRIDELTNHLDITTPSVTLKRAYFLEIGGFDQTLVNYEDFQLWLRIAKKEKWYYFNDVLTGIRVRKQSSSNGRKMTYYISNIHKFIVSLKRTGEFTKQQITSVYKFVLDGSINYYSSTSIDNYGWGDFLAGLWLLIKIGRIRLAVNTFFTHFRYLLLRKASGIFKRS